MSLDSLMTHLITLKRPTNTQDTSGGVTKVFNAVTVNGQTTFPASVQPMRFQEKMQWAQRQIFITHVIYTTIDLGALPGDIVTVPATSKTFVVVGFGDMAGRHEAFKIHAREQAAVSGSP